MNNVKKYFLIVGFFVLNFLIFLISIILAIFLDSEMIIFSSALLLLFIVNISYFYFFLSANTSEGDEIEAEKDVNFYFLEDVLKLNEQGIISLNDDNEIVNVSKNLSLYGFDYFLAKKLNYFNELEEKKIRSFLFENEYWKLNYLPSSKIIIVTNKTNEYVLKKKNQMLDLIFKFKINHESASTYDKFTVNTLTNEIYKIFAEFLQSQNGYFTEKLSELSGFGVVKISNFKNFTALIKNTLSQIDQKLDEANIQINYSIGIGLGYEDFYQINKLASEALKNSELRGINQVSVKEASKPIQYISETSKAAPSTFLKILDFIDGFYKKIEDADHVYITTHKDADLDAFGSAVSLHYLFEQLGIKSKIVMKTKDNTTYMFYNKKYLDHLKDVVITTVMPNEITSKSVLFITDTSNSKLLQQADIHTYFDRSNVFIIDHHEEANNIDIDLKNKLLNNSSSSASELIIRIIKNFPETIKKISLPSLIADALLAGIYLDTNLLNSNTNKFTFESIAYLSDFGISIPEITSYISSSKYDLNTYTNLIKNIETHKNIIISYTADSIILNPDEVSIFADELLDFKDIDAAFVISKISPTKYKISCRSNENYNVQQIAVKLGGGGKINASAIEFDQSTDSTINIETIKQKIIESI